VYIKKQRFNQLDNITHVADSSLLVEYQHQSTRLTENCPIYILALAAADDNANIVDQT